MDASFQLDDGRELTRGEVMAMPVGTQAWMSIPGASTYDRVVVSDDPRGSGGSRHLALTGRTRSEGDGVGGPDRPAPEAGLAGAEVGATHRDAAVAGGRPRSTAEVVRAVLERLLAKGETPASICEGGCEDFAEEVVATLGEDGRPHRCEVVEVFDMCHVKRFDPVGFDWPRCLATWGVRPPPGVSGAHLDEVAKRATHSWVVDAATGLNHDPEAVEGVATPFALPFFQRWIAHLADGSWARDDAS